MVVKIFHHSSILYLQRNNMDLDGGSSSSSSFMMVMIFCMPWWRIGKEERREGRENWEEERRMNELVKLGASNVSSDFAGEII